MAEKKEGRKNSKEAIIQVTEEIKELDLELDKKRREHDKITKLEKDLEDIKAQKRKGMSWVFLGFGIGSIALGMILYYVTKTEHLWILIVGICFGSLYLIGFLAQLGNTISLKIQKKEIEDELYFLTLPETNIEERAEKLFRGHQRELKKYYDQTRRQSLWILVVGVICIFVGFIIIGGTAYVLFFVQTENDISEKVVTAATGLVGAILTNFIGTIYITMYKGAIGTLTAFHKKLVTTHHLHFANFLAAKIEKGPKREETHQRVVENLFKDVLKYDSEESNTAVKK